jgi:hypothetical protein
VLKIATTDQLLATFLIKGLNQEAFERIQKLAQGLGTRGPASFVLGGFKSVPLYPGCPNAFFMSYILTTLIYLISCPIEQEGESRYSN